MRFLKNLKKKGKELKSLVYYNNSRMKIVNVIHSRVILLKKVFYLQFAFGESKILKAFYK